MHVVGFVIEFIAMHGHLNVKFRDLGLEQFSIGCYKLDIVTRGDGLLKAEACGCLFCVKI